jgi:ribonuclease VapC
VIVVDTSAVMAVLLDEPEAADFRLVLSQESDIRISAMNDFEVRLVAFNRIGASLLEEYRHFVGETGAIIADFRAADSLQAFASFLRWGKGRHPAGLNFGDCAAYALAKNLDAPLLFKGTDFAKTDVRRAL